MPLRGDGEPGSVLPPTGRIMKNLVERLIREEHGQDMVEYALLVGGIGLIVITGANDIGTAVDAAYGRIEGDVAAIAP